MDKVKKFLPILLGVLLGLSSCAVGGTGSAPPELLTPVSAQIRIDTALVTRGNVAEVERRTGIVRTDSTSLNFGPVSASFGRFYVQPGDTVTEGQLLASLDMTHLEEQIENQEEHIARLRRDFDFDNELRRIDIEIQALELRAMRIAPAPPPVTLSPKEESDYDQEYENEDENIHDDYDEDDTQNQEDETPPPPPDVAPPAAADTAWLSQELSRARLELELALERQALTLRHEEEDLQEMRTRLAQSFLYAPFSGTVTYISQRPPGAWVSSFEPMIYIASEDAQIFVEYDGGQPYHHAMGARVVAHIGEETFYATRLSITREQVQRYERPPIRFVLDTDSPPPVGSFVSLHIYTAWEEDVLRLPRNTLFFHPDLGFYVYQVTGAEREMVVVSVGIRSETYVEILGGLGEGDEVYVRG